MDFARRQRDPKRHLVGFSFVILLHVLVIWGLMTGLGRKAIEVIKKPISATIVEEIKKPPPPPPPPPKKIIEQPKIQAPVQPYVPPPDIPPPPQPQVEAPVIQSSPVPPPEAYVIAPPPPVIAPPAPPPKPAIQQAAVTCPNQEKPTFPRDAMRRGVERGEVAATLSIDENGNVTDVNITSSVPPGAFDRAVKETLGSWKCVGQGEKIRARAIITFRME